MRFREDWTVIVLVKKREPIEVFVEDTNCRENYISNICMDLVNEYFKNVWHYVIKLKCNKNPGGEHPCIL